MRKLEEFVQRFGAPDRFINDRGTSFTFDAFKDFCNRQGIKITFNSTKHAQANGQVERLNQTILPALQAGLTDFEGRHWDDNLMKLERDLNTSVCKTTGKTPFESLYGYIPRFDSGLARELVKPSETYKLPEEIRYEIKDKVQREQLEAKKRYDKNRLKNVKYNVGDIIVVKASKLVTGESKKLQSRNKGPLVITKVLPADTYGIQSLTAKRNSKRTTTAHVSQIKIWRGFESESDDESVDDSENEIEMSKSDECHENENSTNVTIANEKKDVCEPEKENDCKL